MNGLWINVFFCVTNGYFAIFDNRNWVRYLNLFAFAANFTVLVQAWL